MGSRTPRLTANQMVKQLKSAGFVEASQSGSHLKLFNPETRRMAVVQMHGSKVIAIGTQKAIEKQSGIKFS